MHELKHASLGDQISKKISAWILILVVTIVIAIFFVSFFLSRQIFDKQISIWNRLAVKQVLTNLIDSDDFPINREIDLLESTELFSSFVITDNNKRIISQFGSKNFLDDKLIPIKDSSKVVWGYYYFKPDFNHFITPFVIAATVFLILVSFLYFAIRWRISASLENKFSHFNDFLAEIEAITQQLHLIYHEGYNYKINSKSTSNEQVIINSAISRLLEEIQKANKSLHEAIENAEQRRFQEELTRTALQVAHDIASPLAVLEIIQSTTVTFPEESRVLIRNATSKIRDISNVLLKKAKRDFSSPVEDRLVQQMLVYLIGQVVSEKRMQYGNRAEIIFKSNASSYKIFTIIKPVELSRVLSNIINNSVEAIEHNKKILISLIDSDNEAIIQMQDYGKGIAAKFLNQIGELGRSFGKPEGTGVGLNHAISTIKDCGGRFDIKSVEGVGTTIQIHLPKNQPPSWFIPEIRVFDSQCIVIIDDDESIHAVWERKFSEFQKTEGIILNLVHLYSSEELTEWKAKTIKSDVMYLCDYEFTNTNFNGIDLITKLQINNSSILVTSRVIDEVVLRCESENIKLLPKSIVSAISITAFCTSENANEL